MEKWDVDGVNKTGECLVDTCGKRRLFLANAYFQVYLEERLEG